MTIKLKMIALSLVGFISTSIADTTFFKNNAVSVTPNSSPYGYKISINQVETILTPGINILDRNIDVLDLASKSSKIQEIGKPIWSFTTKQLPITDTECLEASSATCNTNEDIYCYHHCLMGTPDMITFDEKNNKLYFMQGTIMIGTGGGPAFLFVADINKKEVILLHEESYQEQGSLSPSGRYFLMHGYSIIKMYDTKYNTRVEINKSENILTENKDIRHSLIVKNWLNDTQFTYVDIARYFVRPIPENGEPFFSSKEVTYDITSRKILSERKMTEKEANDYEKSLGYVI